MKTSTVTIVFSVLILLSSCKETSVESETVVMPRSSFDSPFPKNNKRLSGILGDILRLKNGNDTITLRISSSKNDNLIVDNLTGDTVFFGAVCKYRDLYYFSQKLNDSSYYLGAVRIKGKLLYGLRDLGPQRFEVDYKISTGNNAALIKYINRDTTVIRLHTDKRELKKLFTSILYTAIPDTILNYDEKIEVSEKTDAIAELENDEIENGFKIYPNPATDFINIETKSKSRATFQLSDLNGRTILKGQLNDLVNRVELGNQKAGIYLLTTTRLENNTKETMKLIIE